MKNILIGSNGGLTGIFLAKKFSESGKYRLFGTDSADLTAGKFFVDEECKVPSSTDKNFIESIIKVLNDKKIDYYFPTHSKEVRVVSAHEEYIKSKTKTKFIVSPIETFEALDDKEQLYYSLTKEGIPTPELIEGEPTSYPVFMKKNVGSGGSGAQKISEPILYDAYKLLNVGASFFTYIDGKEYTVDCMFDKDGELLAHNCRERVKMMGGAAIISVNHNEIDVTPWLIKMASIWKFCGCVNFQFIWKDNTPYFTDINLRYPSGGLPLTVKSGIDVPTMLIRLLDGEKIVYGEYKADDNVSTMYRYFDEKYE